MIITPTNTGSAVAGAGVGIFGWSLALKGNKIPWVKKLYTDTRKEQLFSWMNGNRSMALLALEALNFGIHGITNANAVIFALGNTIVNIVGLWVFLPFRQRRIEKTRTRAILHGVKA
jgi:hypothetical protein